MTLVRNTNISEWISQKNTYRIRKKYDFILILSNILDLNENIYVLTISNIYFYNLIRIQIGSLTSSNIL